MFQHFFQPCASQVNHFDQLRSKGQGNNYLSHGVSLLPIVPLQDVQIECLSMFQTPALMSLHTFVAVVGLMLHVCMHRLLFLLVSVFSVEILLP